MKKEYKYDFPHYGQILTIATEDGKITGASVEIDEHFVPDSDMESEWEEEDTTDENGIDVTAVASVIYGMIQAGNHSQMKDSFPKDFEYVDTPMDSEEIDGQEVLLHMLFKPTNELIGFKTYFSSYDGFDGLGDDNLFTAPLEQKTVFVVGEQKFINS